jgi:uncharacterized membrane protein YqjE
VHLPYIEMTTAVQNLPDRDRRTHLLWVMAAAILILNLIDGVVTLAVVHAGAAEEANPLMALSLTWGDVEFMIIKLGLVSLGVALLWRMRNNRYAAVAMTSLAAIYSLVFLYHFRSMHVLVTTLAS